MTPEWTIRPFAAGDEPGILQLFNAVFSEGNPDFEPRTPEHWRWQFAENPLGHHTFVAEAEGEIVGTYTAIPGTYLHEGAPFLGSQAVDTCVDARFRRVLKREGLFLTLARAWFDHHGVPERDRIVWGLPNPVAFRIGTKRLDYRPVHAPVVALNRNFGDDWIGWLGQVGADEVEVAEVDAFPDGTAALADRAVHGHGLVQRRDREWLDWRYRACPSWRYRILAATDPGSGALRGVLVLRTGWMGRPVAPLVDWIVPADDGPAAKGLVRAAARAAAAEGISLLE
ncbi:MAG: GNAT family N-acetyltransferase, partial [Planctomycetota bacterium JB042]